MKETIKRLFKAKYDVHHQEIVGATEGSIVWHHEDRHRQQCEDYYLREVISYLAGILYGVGGAFIPYGWSVGKLKAAFALTGIVATPLIAVNLLMELDAWQYCIRKYLAEQLRGNSQGDTR